MGVKAIIATLLLMLTVSAAWAQDLAGQWQGLLHTPRGDLRVAFTFVKGDHGIQATMYSIDQGGGRVAGTATTQGQKMSLAIPAIAATYDGMFSADVKTIEGTFRQAGGSMPLSLKQASAEEAWAIPAPPAALRQMPASAAPKVDVSSVKPSHPEAQGIGITMRDVRTLVAMNTPVTFLIGFAYDLHPKQVIGAPSWAGSERYDLAVQADIE
ncbi:MAG: TIGR03435 family protein, partial [Acidobacteriaceae bacterium]|nr:TIGR03435 family protein [Acidobacteriaceae bacterium]